MDAEAQTQTQTQTMNNETTAEPLTEVYTLRPPSPPTDNSEIENTEPMYPMSIIVPGYMISHCETIAERVLKFREEQIRIQQIRIIEAQIRYQQLREQRKKEAEERERQNKKLEQQRKRDQYRHLFDNNYTRGQFDYITDKPSRKLVKNAWKAVQLTETADFVKQPVESFSWSKDPRIWVISKKMEEIEDPPGHSGFTFGWTMRQVQACLQEGEDNYRLDCLIDQMFKT